MTQCPHCGSALTEGHRCYVIPTSCWRPRENTGIPADAQMYPPGCPDPDWCRGNRACYWLCTARDEEWG